jgi:hypothetical protein
LFYKLKGREFWESGAQNKKKRLSFFMIAASKQNEKPTLNKSLYAIIRTLFASKSCKPKCEINVKI